MNILVASIQARPRHRLGTRPALGHACQAESVRCQPRCSKTSRLCSASRSNSPASLRLRRVQRSTPTTTDWAGRGHRSLARGETTCG